MTTGAEYAEIKRGIINKLKTGEPKPPVSLKGWARTNMLLTKLYDAARVLSAQLLEDGDAGIDGDSITGQALADLRQKIAALEVTR